MKLRKGEAMTEQTLRTMLSRGHMRMVLFAVFLATASLALSGVHALRGYAAENVVLSTRSLAYSVEPALVFGDREAARDMVMQLGRAESLSRIEIDDAQGEPFVQWERGRTSQSGLRDVASRMFWLGPVTQEISFRGEKVGSVRVTGSLQPLLRYALSALVIALCCLAITVLATRILARKLEQSIAGPLEDIAQIAHEVSQERRLARRLDRTGIVEIDRFSDNFNALLEELEGWQDSLTHENAELSRRADHDPLTGLGNRARFERMFDAAIKVADKSGRQVALLYLDCNGFKGINDNHGHDVGDAVICTIAERLRNSIRDRDRVFRLGGDEFAIVLDNLVSADAVELVAARITENMREPINVALQVARTLSLSMGVAIYPADGDTTRVLVRVADQRMYREKRGELTHD